MPRTAAAAAAWASLLPAAAGCTYNATLGACDGTCPAGTGPQCLPASCPPPDFPCCGCAAHRVAGADAPQCSANSECTLPCPLGDHNVCDSGVCKCVPDARKCSNDSQCPLPCPVGLDGVCDQGACKCARPGCKVDSECTLPCPLGDHNACDGGVCKCVPDCKADSQCTLPCPLGDHNACDGGVCKCVPDCKADSQCTLPCPLGDHNACDGGVCKCVPDVAAARRNCTDDRQCPLPCPAGQVGVCDHGTCACAAPSGKMGWLEQRIAAARAAVQAKYGAVFEPVEVDINPGAPNPAAMPGLASAAQLHYDAANTTDNATFPGVEAFCNVTAADPAVACTFVYHTDPIMGDETYPPFPVGAPGYQSAEAALAAIRAKAECPAFSALSVRFPVLPCATEHLYIYACLPDPAQPANYTRYFVGARTGRVCRTASTELGSDSYCLLPDNRPDCL